MPVITIMKISIITTVVALLASSNNLVAAKKIRGNKKGDSGDSVLPDGAIPAIFPEDGIGADSLSDCGLAKCPRGYICDTGGPTSGNAYCVPCGQLDQPCCDDESNAAAFSGCATQGLFCDLTTDPLVGPVGSGTCTTQACGANTASCCPGWECDFVPFDATTGTGGNQICQASDNTCQFCGRAPGELCCVIDGEYQCANGLFCDFSGAWPNYVCQPNIPTGAAP